MFSLPDKRFECERCGKEYYRYKTDCSICNSPQTVHLKDKFNPKKQIADAVNMRTLIRYERTLKAIAASEDNIDNHIRAQEALRGSGY